MPFPVIPALISAVAPTVVGAIKDAVSPPGRLGKDDFLKLLVAQLKNQNPLNPLSNNEFIGQSAQFSSLEELQNIGKDIGTLTGSNSATAMASASQLLGRSVAATSGTFNYTGQAVSLPYTLASPAGNAVLEITDASGNIVSRQTLGAQASGSYAATFAPSAEGRVLPQGDYRYRIVSVDAAGRSTPLPAVTGNVNGVTLVSGNPVLSLGAVKVTLADITAIATPTN